MRDMMGTSPASNDSATLTGGQAITRQLQRHGIDTVFGLPGAQIYGLFDAFHQAGPDLRVIGARHEQGCAYMAFGAARSTGKPAVYSVVPGPGILNTGAALVTAFGCNAPVLCVTGQVPTAYLGRGRGHLHEMTDQLATLRQLTKWSARIEHAADAPFIVARAFQEMLSGRRGPAALEMPWDVFAQAAPVEAIDPLALAPNPLPDLDRAADAAKLIAEARAPMIMVGGGAIEAGPEILALAEAIGAPVVSFRSGRGIVSDRHELGLTIAAAYRLWPKTDLLIGIGSRLEVPGWRWSYTPPGLKTIRIDIDAAEFRRARPTIGILADSADGARALTDAVARRPATTDRSAYRAAIGEAKRAAEAEIREIQPQMGYIDAIRPVLPDDGFFVDELTQVGFASWFGFPVYSPRSFVSSGYQGTLGSGFATALGVKVANPDRPVVSVCGDGGFMFAVQELATAVQYGIGTVTIVFNNNAYGNVRRDQRTRFAGRVVGADLVNPDLVKLADSFGVAAARVASPDALAPVLEKALANGAPWLIEVSIPSDSESDPWRFIHPAPPAAA